MKKYYIEFKHIRSEDELYDMQSVWFDTEKQALEWYFGFGYVSNTIVSLMSSEWDEYEDTYTDIKFERSLNLWDLN